MAQVIFTPVFTGELRQGDLFVVLPPGVEAVGGAVVVKDGTWAISFTMLLHLRTGAILPEDEVERIVMRVEVR